MDDTLNKCHMCNFRVCTQHLTLKPFTVNFCRLSIPAEAHGRIGTCQVCFNLLRANEYLWEVCTSSPFFIGANETDQDSSPSGEVISPPEIRLPIQAAQAEENNVLKMELVIDETAVNGNEMPVLRNGSTDAVTSTTVDVPAPLADLLMKNEPINLSNRHNNDNNININNNNSNKGNQQCDTNVDWYPRETENTDKMTEVIFLVCKTCKKVFKNTSSLKKHLIVHKAKDLRCPNCPKKYKLTGFLKRHLKIIHSINEVPDSV